MGHPQCSTPIQKDNSTAQVVVTNNMQLIITKAMDIIFHWICDRDTQKQSRFYLCPGTKNRGDSWTKNHCAEHHQTTRPEILTHRCQLYALGASF